MNGRSEDGDRSIALLGGGEWTEPCRGLDSHLLHLARAPTRCSSLPTAAAFEHPERVVERAVAWFEGLGANATGLPVLNRRDAEADAQRGRDAGRQVRLPRRRLAPAPALGAEGQPVVRRARLRLRPRRGDRGVGRGRDRRLRPDGRSARRRVHGRARARARRRRVPVPRGRGRPPARALGRAASRPTRCSSGSTSRPRSCARRRDSGR